MKLDNPMTGLELTAVLPSLRTERGQRYHDLLLQWKPSFAAIDVPLDIVTEDAGDLMMQDPEVLYMEDRAVMEKLGGLQRKNVFGKETTTVRASLYLVLDTEVAARAGRINESSLVRLWRKAFDIQTRAAGRLMAEQLPDL